MTDTARVIQLGEVLPRVPLKTASGEGVDLAAWRGRPVVLVCVRYYG